MSRISLKIVGAQGQGINSIGEIVAKGLKRTGYCVFGYREYMSLIKGGHSSYQIDVSNEQIWSSERTIDVLVTVNHHGLAQNFREVKANGVIVHNVSDWEWSEKDVQHAKEKNITAISLPVEEILKALQARSIFGNMILTAFLWGLLGVDQQLLKNLVKEEFGEKGEDVLQKNFACIDAALAILTSVAAIPKSQRSDFRIAAAVRGSNHSVSVSLPKPESAWKDHLLVTGSQAMGLGIVHAGCRLYASYPMTPSSPLLTYIADKQNKTGMVVKQAEDEITAVQMMSGAMFMGTRALTATSGGGFDLMTETISLNGLIENPAVVVLAQRPGPATGLPTWTAQGDLLLAAGSSHGEFPRLVLAVSDSQDSFDLIPEAFNYAEEFQIPVIVLTDKQVMEALWTQRSFDLTKAELRRGKLVMDPKELKKLKSTDRYDPDAGDGVSKRWLPGSDSETFCAQGDEHDAEGNVDESSANATAQMEKRMRKFKKLKDVLPEPEVFGNENANVLVVSWGSNKGVILDAVAAIRKSQNVVYLHYTYLWPLKTEKFEKLAKTAKRKILIECNYQGQLGMLLKQEAGIDFDERILKYDGRPFFYDELQNLLLKANS